MIIEYRGKRPKLAGSAFIAPNAVLIGDVEVGEESSIWFGAVLRGDNEWITIGPNSNVQDHSIIHADPGQPVMIGSAVTIGHRVIVHSASVGDGTLIGMGAILLNGVRVGRGSIVGAGAVLVEGTEVPPGSLILGVPGKIVRVVDEAMRARIEHAWRHYVDQAQRHRANAFPIVTPTIPG